MENLKKKIKKHHGIKFYSWLSFCGVVVITMAVLWMMQVVLLTNFYETMKIREIRKIGDSVTEKFGTGEFEEVLYKQSFDNGFWIQFYTADGEPFNPDNSKQIGDIPLVMDQSGRTLGGGFGKRVPFRNDDFENIINEFAKQSGDSIVFKEQSGIFHSESIAYAAKLYDGDGLEYYLLLKAPLADVSATKTVLQHQLVYVTLISLVVGLILAAIFARQISRPISRLTDAAKILARGDYSVEFPQSGVSEINKLGDVLNYAKNELSKNDELRRDLIANVSHDLRTPLTIIKSYAEMIRDLSGDKPEKRSDHTNVIIDEADRLSGLVNDILDLSKYEAGAVKLDMSEFDLSAVVRSVVDKFYGMYENQGYVFEVECDKELLVFADETKINQVIFNLIGNAINYTGEDKRVSVTLCRHGKKVRFSVTDTGSGIAEDEISRVWDRYYRASKNMDRRGSGIGLAIVKNILISHNAEFGIDSKLKEGSTFWFEL